MYPLGPLASHVLGSPISITRVWPVSSAISTRSCASPANMALSVDIRVQHVLEHELSIAMEKFGIGAAGLVMDVETAETSAWRLCRFRSEPAGRDR